MNRNEQLFVQVLMVFHQSAMMSLGKLKNPATDKIERNLDQAREAIEIIEMLRDKTKGNISAQESKLLEGILTELRLNFIDETSKPSIT